LVVTSQPIVLKPKPATFRLVDVVVRGGFRGGIEVIEVVVASLPIVLKPKPATVRLEPVDWIPCLIVD
jgi:hypothetical protein